MAYTLKCQCCGFSRTFADAEEAFVEGWDGPPRFTQAVSCNLCPASFIVLGETHRHAGEHERWASDGRPSEFEAPGDTPQELKDLMREAAEGSMDPLELLDRILKMNKHDAS